MRVALALLGAVGMCAAAASGCGAKVTVDVGTQGTGGGAGGADVISEGGASGAGGTACESSCAAAITNGGELCATDALWVDDLSELQTCADMSCFSECMGQFPPAIGGLDSTCGSCLTANCPTQQVACENN